MRGIARLIAWSGGAAVCFLLVLGCQDEGGCRGFCENAAGVECLDTSVDECVSECEEFEADVHRECRSAWRALRDCAAEGEWTCEAATCIPSSESESDSCGSEPVLIGCSEEASRFESCGGGDDDCEEGGGGGTSTIDGRVVEFDFSSDCGACTGPLLGGAPASSECTEATDCEQYCCVCPDASVYVQVCIDGFCASDTEACDDSLGACDGFH